MSLIDFLKEEKAERKKRKQLQKEQKKGNKTPEQKRMKIYAIITGFLIVFGVLFYTCRNAGGYSWNDILGITDEMIVELEKEVDEDVLFPNGKITDMDWHSCDIVLKSAGIDLESDEDISPTTSFVLTDRELGALSKKLLVTIDTSIIKNISDLELYVVGNKTYLRSVVDINLSDLVMGATLPKVYLTTTSHIELLSNSITCMTNEIKINNLSSELNEELLSVLDSNSSTNLKSIGNEIISTLITIFGSSIGCEMVLMHGQIQFNI